MTNFNAIAANPTAAASLSAADILVIGNPDVPAANKATTLAQLDAALKLIAATTTGAWTTGAGTGITAGTGTIYRNSVRKTGGIYTAEILIDLTGLSSQATDLDIIGVGAGAAYLGRILAAQVGTVLTVEMMCLEAPAGGVTDIDLYSAVEATGVYDAGIGTLDETALITSGGAWTNGLSRCATVVPPANGYLYLTSGAAGTNGTYTAGKFLITIKGYDA